MVSFQFSERLRCGIVDLFCSSLVHFPPRAIGHEVIEEAVPRQSLGDVDAGFPGAFISEAPSLFPHSNTNHLPIPLPTPQTMNERHEETHMFCHPHVLCLQLP